MVNWNSTEEKEKEKKKKESKMCFYNVFKLYVKVNVNKKGLHKYTIKCTNSNNLASNPSNFPPMRFVPWKLSSNKSFIKSLLFHMEAQFAASHMKVQQNLFLH